MKIVENEMVTLLFHHDGTTGELNDNEHFVSSSHAHFSASKENYRAEEYFDSWCEVYKFEDKWGMYFSVPQNGAISEVVDGYVIESPSFTELWSYFAETKGISLSNKYVTELMDDTVNHFTSVSSEKSNSF